MSDEIELSRSAGHGDCTRGKVQTSVHSDRGCFDRPGTGGRSASCSTCYYSAIKPHQDKRVRLFTQQALFAAGRVWFPCDAPWLRVFLDELLSFPESPYSDQVDSLSRTLAFEGGYDPGAIADFLSSFTESYMFRYEWRGGGRLENTISANAEYTLTTAAG